MTRLIGYTLWLICASQVLLAQLSETDSLKGVLDQNLQDPEKLHVLNQLGTKLYESKPDESLFYSRQAEKLAITSDNKSALGVAKINIARYYIRNALYDSALFALDNALGICREIDEKPRIAQVLNLIGYIYSQRSNYAVAEGYYQEAMELFIAVDEKKGLAKLLKDFGIIYKEQGYYHTALDYCQRSLRIYEEINDVDGVANVLNNIAMIYGNRNDNQKALDYFLRSLKMDQERNDHIGIQTGLNNVGYIFKKMGKYQEALQYLYQALKYPLEFRQRCDDFYAYYNIGDIYEITNQLDSASHYLNAALKKSTDCSDQYIISLSRISLGNVAMKRKNYKAAQQHYEFAFNVATQHGMKNEMKDAAKALSGMYEAKKEPGRALEYYKIYYSIRDSLFSQENTNKLARLEAKYEFEQVKKETELLQRIANFEQERELRGAIWLRNSFIVGFAIMALIAFLIYRIYQRKHKANAALNKLNEEIGLQKEELLGRTEELKQANEEISRINQNLESIVAERTKVITAQNNKILDYVYYNSHQVRGPLTRILGLTNLIETDAISEEEMPKVLDDIDKAAKELDAVVKMMNETLENQKKYLENPSKA